MESILTANIILSIATIITTVFILKTTHFFINKMGNKKKVLPKRTYYVIKFLDFFIILLTVLILSVIWNVEFGGIAVFASSIFAVIGMALFAQWSILSNLTSSIIIFFTFPARVGDKIKVLDGDNSVEGIIKEISLFQIEIMDDDKNLILYPNNLFIQKPIIKMNK